MELTHEDIEKHIEQICSRTKLIDIGSGTFLLKQPTTIISIKSRRVHDVEYKKAIDDGLLSHTEMKTLIEGRNLISTDEKNKLSSLKSKLEAQKILLGKTTFVKANQDRIKKVMIELEYQIREIEYKEKSKFNMTAETRAEESKILYLCWSCVYDFYTDKLYWESYEDFEHEDKLVLRQRLVSEFISFYSGILTKIVREIARSNLWRIRYVTSLKTSDPLFGIPTAEYSNDMLNLAYWSHYYQNLYEMMPEDQPPQDIIEDDVALDAYMEAYYKERHNEVAVRKSKKRSGTGKLAAFDQQEVIVTRSNELYEDIEYDTPREAQAIKDRTLIKKKASHQNRAGQLPTKLPRR